MSTTIYNSPEGVKNGLSIDITYSTVWFFQETDDVPYVVVALDELPAIHKAIGEYLEVVE
jgi:hypothetical protein